MQLAHDSEQKPEVWALKNHKWALTNWKRSGTQCKTPWVKTQRSQQRTYLTWISIPRSLIKNGQITRHENERNCQIVGG